MQTNRVNQKSYRLWVSWALCLLMTFLAGCSSVRPWVNSPLPDGVIRPDPDVIASLAASDEDLSMIVAVTLSGGGARASAFAYGVLQALHQTPIAWGGRNTTLLNRVGFVSGVSGGSILAAYYAAFGTETFERFEPEFLRQNFQDSLISLALKPGNLIDLSSPWFGRSQLLARRLDELYRGKTFADVWARPGHPRLLISATDLSLGSSFEFSWEQFSRICSDLSTVPLSFAVASSSAVPIALSPVTLKNYAGSCKPEDADASEVAIARDAQKEGEGDYRARLLRSQLSTYQDVRARPFIHLVDGGVADNLGVRGLIDKSMTEGGIRRVMRQLPKGVVRKLVLITVNAERDPSERIDESDKVPSTLQVVDAMLFGTGARATNETLGLLGDVEQQWKRELGTAARDGQSAFADDAQVHVITVNLRDAPEAMERSRLLQIPTAFSIPIDDVTRLIQAGRHVLEQSAGFKELMSSLRRPAQAPPAP
ncbi:MAG: patatin-like phospholipase family protein [Pseudomonadota bacterium]